MVLLVLTLLMSADESADGYGNIKQIYIYVYIIFIVTKMKELHHSCNDWWLSLCLANYLSS